MQNIHFIGQCVRYLLEKVFISLVKDPNVQFVRVGQDFFALAIIFPIFFLIWISFCPTKCGFSGTDGANFLDPWPWELWGPQQSTGEMHGPASKREILIGIKVAQITTDFPTIDLSEAIADIKASKPGDLTLQALKPPGKVGGQIDILLGIQYLSHFPKLVHTLDNGLSIFEVQLTPSSPEVTAAIAGPHHSFNLILDHVGYVVTMITAFKRGLDRWNAHGPPLNSTPATGHTRHTFPGGHSSWPQPAGVEVTPKNHNFIVHTYT
jgi:hypothetical protein